MSQDDTSRFNIHTHIYIYIPVHICIYAYIYIYMRYITCNTSFISRRHHGGVATISRLLKTLGLFCKRALLKRQYSAKETYNFINPTNRGHPIYIVWCMILMHIIVYALNIYTDIYIYVYTYTYICMYTYMYVYIYIYIYIHIYVYIYTYIHIIHLYICIYVYTYI